MWALGQEGDRGRYRSRRGRGCGAYRRKNDEGADSAELMQEHGLKPNDISTAALLRTSSKVDSPPFVNGQVAPVRELRSELKQVDGRAPGGSAMTLVSLGG